METPFRPKNFLLCAICLPMAIFMYVLDTTIANVALPSISGNLGASTHQSTWIITSFAISNAIALPLTGWLSRRFGEVRLFILSITLFTIASALCGLASNMGLLIVFRAMQGFVAGPIYPVTQSLLIAIFPSSKRAQAITVITMVVVFAPIGGPIIGGWITDNYSWPWIFFINVPVGIFASIVIWKQMGSKPEKTQRLRIDYVGLISLAIAISSLQILLDSGNDKGWFDSNFIIILAITTVISTAIFFIWETYEENPIIDLRIFRHRNFTIGTLAYTLSFGAYFGGTVLMPIWMQTHLGYTPYLAGLAVAPAGLLPLFLGPLIGKYAHQTNLRLMASISFVVIAYTFYLRSKFNLDVTFEQICFVQLLQGLGTLLMFIPIMTILLSDLKPDEIAAGAGLAMFVRSIGASFLVSITNYLWNSRATLHHSQLAENFTQANGNTIESLQRLGGSNPELALRQLDFMINAQAYQISFNEVFLLLAIMVISLTFIVWFTKPPFDSKTA